MISKEVLLLRVATFLLVLVVLVGCGQTAQPETSTTIQPSSPTSDESQDVGSDAGELLTQIESYIAYQPPFSPVKLVVGSQGVSIEAAFGIVTPIGTFELGTQIPLDSRNEEAFILVLRDHSKGIDTAYEIRGNEQVTIVVDGLTEITLNLSGNTITVDIKEGDIIEISGLEISVPSCSSARPTQLRGGMDVLVIAEEVNVRSLPNVPESSGANVIGTVTGGTVLTIVDGVACSHDGYWWKVQRGGHRGMDSRGNLQRHINPTQARSFCLRSNCRRNFPHFQP
ncbi:MAG TPA: hypothetical protein VF707_13280 [Ardenticatenaceae bacterium]|jgi:hypothetical protein